MIPNNIDNQAKGTLELKNSGDNDTEMKINTASINYQEEAAGSSAASVLFFIKRFTNPKLIDASGQEYVDHGHLEILMPILLWKSLTFLEAKSVILKELKKIEPHFEMENYEMVLELPCFAVGFDSCDLLEASRNGDALGDVARGFMQVKNTDRVRVGSIEDGSMVIFVSKEDMKRLEIFLNEKSNEIYLYLKDKTGKNEGVDYGDSKFKFSYVDTYQQI
jgi:hypothetical protein